MQAAPSFFHSEYFRHPRGAIRTAAQPAFTSAPWSSYQQQEPPLCPDQLAVQHKRVGAEAVAQFHKRHLGCQPAGILGDGIHGLARVVAEKKNARAKHQVTLEASSGFVPGEFKITRTPGIGDYRLAKCAEIPRKVTLKVAAPRSGVGQNASAIGGERDNRPLIEYQPNVALVHLTGAGLDEFVCQFQCHSLNNGEKLSISEANCVDAHSKDCHSNQLESIVFKRSVAVF